MTTTSIATRALVTIGCLYLCTAVPKKKALARASAAVHTAAVSIAHHAGPPAP